MDKDIFYYNLPEELIAQEPLEDRSASRMLVLGRNSGTVSHFGFKNITDYLCAGDCLVLNDTRVIPARLMGVKDKTGAVIEILLLKKISKNTWETLARPAKRLKVGDTVYFGDGLIKGHVSAVLSDGIRHMEMEYEGVFEEALDRLGEMPLPPYITKMLEDRNRYQTVYAKKTGSAAAPTAGLHFTPEILASLEDKGVKLAKITLHIGLGTFRPIKVRNILEHEMHSEYFEINAENAAIINETRSAGGRIVCVGTTVVRALESAVREKLKEGEAGREVKIAPINGWTDIFIYPGFEFSITDMLLTNFHLPESTLIALVSAFAGTENVMMAYSEAVAEKYRFFSFGDAMLIV